ncbi:pyridoxamine 5'-phosphate oxidase family protein [Solidesulfovibrio alcoholivorans]|uniref:pyridoxamine 5'-phosphate oxidase family protein n=1 Tax=Solidesulfovibrio alcoholivorans TaxID=81406 RepID=UPI0004950511|nr:pyridoxamine 5'-phosphate oxidase family protein [Solidesulfovibrio alcoholivorans]
MEILRRIAAFITEMDFAVLSALSPEGPWISLMSYLPGSDGLTVCLAMSTGSYKAKLIRENPNVALLIDNRCRHDDPGRVTALSMHGTAGHVTDPAERGKIVADFQRHRPHLDAFLGRPDTGIVRVTPRSFQLFDGVDRGEFIKHGEAGWHHA